MRVGAQLTDPFFDLLHPFMHIMFGKRAEEKSGRQSHRTDYQRTETTDSDMSAEEPHRQCHLESHGPELMNVLGGLDNRLDLRR